MALRLGWHPKQEIIYRALTSYQCGDFLNNAEVLIHFGTSTYPGSFFVSEKAVTVYYKAGLALKRVTVPRNLCKFYRKTLFVKTLS